jgi:hypothetical protein
VGVSIPQHLLNDVELSFARPEVGGVAGWRSEGEPSVFWTGTGYASLALKSKVDIMKSSGQEGAILTGMVFFYLEPPPAGGLLPMPTDALLIDGVACEVLSVRPANSLIDYWKAEVRTGSV